MCVCAMVRQDLRRRFVRFSAFLLGFNSGWNELSISYFLEQLKNGVGLESFNIFRRDTIEY